MYTSAIALVCVHYTTVQFPSEHICFESIILWNLWLNSDSFPSKHVNAFKLTIWMLFQTTFLVRSSPATQMNDHFITIRRVCDNQCGSVSRKNEIDEISFFKRQTHKRSWTYTYTQARAAVRKTFSHKLFKCCKHITLYLIFGNAYQVEMYRR